MTDESRRTVWVALVAGFGVTLAKVAAAIVTGSAALAAEAAHSLADSANDLFLLVAQRRSTRPRDAHHPFGYGREAYFWALIAALGLFVGGAAFSLREGIAELVHPSATSSFAVAYVILAVSALFDLVSLRQSAHQMSVEARLANRTVFDQAATTSDPSLRGVFNEDAVSIAGDLFALIGVALSQITGSSIPQAIAAVLIALVMIRVSLRLIRRNHDFLLGQPIPTPDRERIQAFILGYPGVTAVRELLVSYVGPDQVWVLTRIDIAGDLDGNQVETLVGGIEEGLKHRSSHIYRVDVVPIGDGSDRTTESGQPEGRVVSEEVDPSEEP
jgi:cation diffusion facilitator family transporter